MAQNRLTPQQIAALARARGLDPQAVLAVARQEGLGGGIGDGGHAYGPFQLNNAGGVITKQYGGRVNDQGVQDWAWSPAGVNYALDGIAGVAKGLKGRQAVNAIVSRFERPANPGREIAGALAAYGGSLGSGGAGVDASSSPAPAAAGTPAAPPVSRQALVNALMQASQSGDYTGFFSKVKQSRQAPPAESLPVSPGQQPPTSPLPYSPGKGGRLAELLHEGVGGPTHSTGEHIHFASTDPQVELAGIRLAQQLGLSVRENPYTDPVDPVHTKNSYHYRTFPGSYDGKKLGEAADVSGSEAAMLKFYRLMQQRYGGR